MNYQYHEFEFPTTLAPFEIFERLEQRCTSAFILESMGAESEFSRFTYLGADPHAVVSGKGNTIVIDGVPRHTDSPYRALARLLPHVEGLPAHYHGGLVGYVSYDGTAYFEPAFRGAPHPAFPQFEFGLYFDGLLYDKREKAMRYFTLGEDRRGFFQELLSTSHTQEDFVISSTGQDIDTPRYRRAFDAIKGHILAGDVFQTVFSIGFTWDVKGSPIAVYRKLREINPSPHMYCIKFGTRYVLGASPELLFRTAGRAIEHFGTLAGTVKRGATPEEDEQLARQLQSDEKEVAEHIMLVDLARNDVGKVAEFGSVRAKKLMTIKKYSHVQHMSTEIRGTLREGLTSFDVLAACAPAGTLSGAPKIEAMKLIVANEGSPRGPYGGSVGYFSVNGDAMFAIAIRSLFVAGSIAYTRSGGGLVYDSVCEKEYEEVMNKQKAMQKALELSVGETRVSRSSERLRSASPPLPPI